MPVTTFACPKSMEYGPCGGVEFDGSCEVDPHRCVFLDLPTVRWHGIERSTAPRHPDPVPPPTPSTGSERMRARLATGRVVVADLPARALDAGAIQDSGRILGGHVDAVLAGDSGAARVQFPPAYRAGLLKAAGLEVWSGLNCRDRNRVAMEGELAALAHVGVAGVHCVTGDHPQTGSRPDTAPVFDLDSTEEASLARAAGHLVSVGEAPATPPVDRRPSRLLEKVRAGAEVCFVNHAGGIQPVREFISRSQDLGANIWYIPCVPIVIDRGSAELLASFTTLVLPHGFIDRILSASDPRAEGIAAAIELCEGFLRLDGVAGVNLSGGAAAGRENELAEVMAGIADALD